jgi:hypothetical protein
MPPTAKLKSRGIDSGRELFLLPYGKFVDLQKAIKPPALAKATLIPGNELLLRPIVKLHLATSQVMPAKRRRNLLQFSKRAKRRH